jgi:hypothetical protein
MTNSALKGIKHIVSLTILSLTFTSACIPIAFQGLPTPIGQTPPPTRGDLCNLLLSVGGTAADVQTCLNANSISDADKARLCAASAGLTDTQKETLKAGLIAQGVDPNTCNSLTPAPTSGPTAVGGTPTAGPTTGPTTGPTSQVGQEPSSEPTNVPSVSASPTSLFVSTPVPTSTSGTGGGGSNGGFGGGSGGSGGTAGTSTVTITKVSVGGTGEFTFTGNNGYTTTDITTTESGVGVAGTTRTLSRDNTATTITESLPPEGFVVTEIECSGLGEGTATLNLNTRSVLLGSNATIPDADIACTFTNTKLPTVTLTKVSNGGTGAFTFTGDNGFTSTNITTVSTGVGVAGTTRTLAAAGTSTTITESTIPDGFFLTGVSCSGLGFGGTATPDLVNNRVVLDTAATAAGSSIACTFTNSAADPNNVNINVNVLPAALPSIQANGSNVVP